MALSGDGPRLALVLVLLSAIMLPFLSKGTLYDLDASGAVDFYSVLRWIAIWGSMVYMAYRFDAPLSIRTAVLIAAVLSIVTILDLFVDWHLGNVTDTQIMIVSACGGLVAAVLVTWRSRQKGWI